MTKAVIFDLNGVITNDEPIHKKSFRQVVKEEGYEFKEDDFEKKMLGKTHLQGFEAVAGRTLSDEERKDWVEKKINYYKQAARDSLETFPGVIRVIYELAPFYSLAVASNSARAETLEGLNILQIRDMFAAVVTAEEVARPKPAKDVYEEAARRLSVALEECLVLEDTPTGVSAAKAAGMYCVAVGHTFSETELEEADKFIPSFHEFDLKGFITSLEA